MKKVFALVLALALLVPGFAFAEDDFSGTITISLYASTGVQEAWEANPFSRVAFDQMQYLNETHVSAYLSEIDNEVVSSLEAFASDDISVADEMENLKAIMESVLPNGIVDSYE